MDFPFAHHAASAVGFFYSQVFVWRAARAPLFERISMTIFGRVVGAFPLAGALLLASCGGGGSISTPASNQQASQGVAVGEPSPNATLDTAQFVTMARGAACSDWRNRLFVVDQKYVYWDRAGNCPDASYAQGLYGKTTDKLLCSTSDSIAGPRTSCSDESVRALFETIQKNGDKATLGLDSSHKVEPLTVLPKEGGSISFSQLSSEAFSSIHSPRNVVIRDAAAFAALWAEHHAGRSPAPALPKVDFSGDMVLASFAGDSSGCQEFGIARVLVGADRIVAEVETRDIQTLTVCTAVVTAPMSMVTVARSDAAVDFAVVKPDNLNFAEIERTTRSLFQTADNRVIRDAAAWEKLWAEHAGREAKLPAVDFSKQMVIATFLGNRPNGCYSTDIDRVVRAGNKIKVDRIDWVPGEQLVCTAQITSPAHLVRVDRSDDVVEFSSQIKTVQ